MTYFHMANTNLARGYNVGYGKFLLSSVYNLFV